MRTKTNPPSASWVGAASRTLPVDGDVGSLVGRSGAHGGVVVGHVGLCRLDQPRRRGISPCRSHRSLALKAHAVASGGTVRPD